jgi:hypothetical protein
VTFGREKRGIFVDFCCGTLRAKALGKLGVITMKRSRLVFISSLILCALPACGGADGETVGPPGIDESQAGTAGSAGAQAEGWGASGEAGAFGDAGAAGAAGADGEAGAAGDTGVAGGAGQAGAAGADGFGGSAGMGGAGGTGGAGGSGGSSGSFTGNGGSGGTGGSGGSGGSSGSFTGNGGSGGSGGSTATITPFVASIDASKLQIYCVNGTATLGGSYTAKYTNLLLQSSTSAAVVKSHALLTKNGVTMSYSFPVEPAMSPWLAKGSSASVVHKAKAGSGTANMCNFCGASMKLEVEWLLSNKDKRVDSYGPVPINCYVPI